MATQFEVFENSKENILPLQQGRDASMLASKFGSNVRCDEHSSFLEGCKEWEEKLQKPSDDPLQIWDQYIKWVQQQKVSGGKQEDIIKLLQRATRQFQSVSEYKNDSRYLRIWIKYIDSLHDPSDVFEFLQANDIGQDLALFYISWAFVLEHKLGKHSEAWNKLEEGISRAAQPLDKLKTELKAFQHRMNKKMQEQIAAQQQQQQQQQEEASSSSFVQRKTLGELASKSSRTTAPRPTSTSQGIKRPLLSSSSSSTTASGVNPKSGGFSIFSDENAGSGDANPKISGSNWKILPDPSERIKENVEQPAKWSEHKVPMSSSSRSSSTSSSAVASKGKAAPSIDIFVDEECEQQQQQLAATAAASKPDFSMKLRLDGATALKKEMETNTIQKTPTAFLKPAGVTTTTSSSSSLPAPRPTVGPSTGNTDGKKEVSGYRVDLMSLPDGEVLSFEERRVLELFGEAAWNGTQDFTPKASNAYNEPTGTMDMSLIADTTGKIIEIVPLQGWKPQQQLPPQPPQQPSSKYTNFADDEEDKAFAATFFKSFVDQPAVKRSRKTPNNDNNTMGTPKRNCADNTTGDLTSVLFPPTATATFKRPAVSPTMHSAAAAADVLALIPSPTVFVNKNGSTNHDDDDDDDDDDTGGYGQDFMSRVVSASSPTVNTKIARKEVLKALSSPTMKVDAGDAKLNRVRVSSKAFARTVENNIENKKKIGNDNKSSEECVGKNVQSFAVFSDKEEVDAVTVHNDKQQQQQQPKKTFEIFADAEPLSTTTTSITAIKKPSTLFSVYSDSSECALAPAPVSSAKFMIFNDNDNENAAAPAGVKPKVPSFTVFSDDESSIPPSQTIDNNMDSDEEEQQQQAAVEPPQSPLPTILEASTDSAYSNRNLSTIGPNASQSRTALSALSALSASSSSGHLSSSILSKSQLHLTGVTKSDDAAVRNLTFDNKPIAIWSKEEEQRRTQAALSSNISGLVTANSEVKFPATRILNAMMKNGRLGSSESLVKIGKDDYHVHKPIGSGAEGNVFQVQQIMTVIKTSNTTPLYALKHITQGQVAHSAAWEHLCGHLIQSRLQPEFQKYFHQSEKAILYSDSTVLMSAYLPQPSLQHVINAHRKMGKSMDESLIIWYSAQLTAAVHALHHQAKFLHNDIKPDNIMLREDDPCEEMTFDNDNDDGDDEPSCGICLLDFGHSIDLTFYPDNVSFIGGGAASCFECVEITEKKPWKYEQDTFGVAAVIHTMLHLEYMKVIRNDENNKIQPRLAFKRYWERELWSQVFDKLLNDHDLDGASKLLWKYFDSNPDKKKRIPTLLAKQSVLLDQMD